MRSIENWLRRSCGVALLLAAVLSLAACGGSGEPEDEPATTSPSTAPPPSSTPDSTTAEPTTPPSMDTTTPLPTPARGDVTLRGVIQPGVEPGCLLLDGEGGPYLLLGGQQVMQAGADVVVRGRVEPDMMTTCQQGVPLMVTEVRPAE